MSPAAELRAQSARHRRRTEAARATARFEWDAACDHLDKYFAALREADRHEQEEIDALDLAGEAQRADRMPRRARC